MFSLAHVILPFSDIAPADAISASLARFQRGTRDKVPEAWLRFDDETAAVEELHRATFTFIKSAGLRVEGGESWNLDIHSILREMERRGLERWTVRFVDIEPDLTRFADRFLRPFDRHPVTHGFGRWLNPLGRWDWWELGGRFDGVITGGARKAVRTRSSIASGPSPGRKMLESIQDAVGGALGEQARETIDVRADANIELVATLRSNLARSEKPRLPGVVVLPPQAADDGARWLRNWPEIGSEEGLTFLDMQSTPEWPKVVATVYNRFADHWAAAVAFHH